MGLMHFDAQETGVNFLYVLPYTARCALVENTWISRAHVHVDDALQLKHMIAKHLQLSAYEIGYQERGALPLLPAQPASAEHVFHLGRSAGCLRASTGFAFANSLWHAHQVADSLRQHIASRSQYAPALDAWRPPAPASRRMDVWMDRVFFQAMEADWPAAPEYFMRMFAHVAPERIVRFMQGSSSALDRLAIMQALPKAPFLRAAWQVR